MCVQVAAVGELALLLGLLSSCQGVLGSWQVPPAALTYINHTLLPKVRAVCCFGAGLITCFKLLSMLLDGLCSCFLLPAALCRDITDRRLHAYEARIAPAHGSCC